MLIPGRLHVALVLLCIKHGCHLTASLERCSCSASSDRKFSDVAKQPIENSLLIVATGAITLFSAIPVLIVEYSCDT